MSSPHTLRRQVLALPSRGRHMVAAITMMIIVLAMPMLATTMFGNPEDASAKGFATIVPLPEPEILPELSDDTFETPDLLAGEVPDNTNPTEQIAAKLDGLGNPIGQPASQTTPREATAPRTIKIDGRSVGPASLAPAPFAGLTQTGIFGPIPAKNAAGGSALNRYNRPFAPAAGKNPVSIIIGGLGVNRALTQRAIDDLPPEVTLSFAAHSKGLQDWINIARADGHEVILEIPMESAGFNPSEPGADRALRLSNSAEDNRRNLDWALSRAQGYWGVTHYNGEAFLQRADVTAPILDRLSQTGLGFVTDGDFETTSLSALSRSVRLPYKAGFGLIDPSADTGIISARLSELNSAALRGGNPIGVGFAYPETIMAVSNWVAGLDAQGLILAPASASLQP